MTFLKKTTCEMKRKLKHLLMVLTALTAFGCRTMEARERKMDKTGIDVVIEQHILTKNPCYTAGRKIQVKGLMLHSVGCPVPSGETWVKLWNKEDYDRACVHAFIDAHTGVVWKTLPWEHRGWHAGGQANNTHIGVEMCESEFIKYTGGATFTTSNLEASRTMARRTYVAAVNLFAYLCHAYHLDPLAKGVIISHNEGHALGVASGHLDPEHLWRQLGLPYSMDGFRQDVARKLTQYK